MKPEEPRGLAAAPDRPGGDRAGGERFGITQVVVVGIIGLLVVGVAATLFLLLERHREIGSAISDSGLWVALQFDRDARKLKDAAWAASLRPDDVDALETVELRYDILYARAGLLTKGQAGERVAADPELSRLVAEIVATVGELEEPVFGLRDRSSGVDDALLARFDGFLETTEDLVQTANVKMGLMSVEEREETLELYQYLAAFMVVSALLTIAFVVALVRTGASNTALRRVEADRARHLSVLRSLIDNMPQGVSLRDADGNLVLWNDNLRQMFNLPADFFDVPRHGDDIVRYQ
jgi:PAS domain-containing protein